ncbi:MAG: peptidylprolyl isomerase [Candidatus Yonathbacteria bacterium]|nr:peptidylprolyl isomerase [Candidatus Yonathbacteria bacterium]
MKTSQMVVVLVLIAVAVVLFFMNDADNKEGKIVENITTNNLEYSKAILVTNLGDIEVEFFSQDAPLTVANFVKLAEDEFYNGTKFHRVIKSFMIQGGDPLSKNDAAPEQWGTGGPGYKFNDEINANSDLYKTGYKRGILAMANSGSDTNGSQFFIMHQDYPLPPKYTIFGRVIFGQEVVDTIATTPTDSNDRPISPITIQKVLLK